jgi:hypothetical protein
MQLVERSWSTSPDPAQRLRENAALLRRERLEQLAAERAERRRRAIAVAIPRAGPLIALADRHRDDEMASDWTVQAYKALARHGLDFAPDTIAAMDDYVDVSTDLTSLTHQPSVHESYPMRWYALRCDTGGELDAMQAVCIGGLQAFVPFDVRCIREGRRRRPRTVRSIMLPGYVLAKLPHGVRGDASRPQRLTA